MRSPRFALLALVVAAGLGGAGCTGVTDPTAPVPSSVPVSPTSAVPPSTSAVPPTGETTTTSAPTTTTEPAPTTTEPAPTTTEPSPTTTEPAPTTTEPAPTTTRPPAGEEPSAPASVADDTTTGVPTGTALTPSGPLTVNVAGTVLDSLDIDGCVKVTADNVVITRSRITCSGGAAVVNQSGGSGLRIENSELRGGADRADAGVWSSGPYTLLNSEITNVRDGAFIASDTTIDGNWIHDLSQKSGDHNDLLQMVGGQHVVIRNNRLEHVRDQTAAIMIKSDLAPIDDVLIENNVLAGGSFSLYVMAGNAAFGGCCGAPTNVSVLGNTIKAGSYLYGQLMIMGNNTVSCNHLDTGELATYVDTDRGTNPTQNTCS
jgi:hypothetical protein